MDYKPKFPYDGKQVIVASDRVHLLAKTDSVFLFAKQSVSLSSTNTVNLDASNGIILQSPSVKLGDVNAKERVILGDTFVKELKEFLSSLIAASDFLMKVSAGATAPTKELGSSMTYIALFGKNVNINATNLKERLDSTLSNITRTA
jgi:hypothetical protein